MHFDELKLRAILEMASLSGCIGDPTEYLAGQELVERATSAVREMAKALVPTKNERSMAQLGKVLFASLDALDIADIGDKDVTDKQRFDKLFDAYALLRAERDMLNVSLERVTGENPTTVKQIVAENDLVKRQAGFWQAAYQHREEAIRALQTDPKTSEASKALYDALEQRDEALAVAKQQLEKIADWEVSPDAANIPHRQRQEIQAHAQLGLARLTQSPLPLQLEVAELEQWIDDLQEGMKINCVYCGAELAPRTEEVDESVRLRLQRHMRYCPKHPMMELRRQFLEFVVRIECADTEANRTLIKAAKKALWEDDAEKSS